MLGSASVVGKVVIPLIALVAGANSFSGTLVIRRAVPVLGLIVLGILVMMVPGCEVMGAVYVPEAVCMLRVGPEATYALGEGSVSKSSSTPGVTTVNKATLDSGAPLVVDLVKA